MYKFDIFTVLNQITKGNTRYLDSYKDEELKELSPFVIQKWIRGASKNLELHLLLTNALCNPYVFSLQKHPKLLYKALCAANGFDDGARYSFIKKPSQKSSTQSVKVVMEYYGYPKEHAVDALNILSNSDVVEMAEELGYDKKELDAIKKEGKCST